METVYFNSDGKPKKKGDNKKLWIGIAVVVVLFVIKSIFVVCQVRRYSILLMKM